MDRWKSASSPASPTRPAQPEKQQGLISEILATAVRQSRSAAELEQRLKILRDNGIEASMDQLFQTLGRQLPDWAVVASPTAGSPTSAPTAAAAGGAEVMHRILTLAEDPEQLARHFNEMVRAAIEQFNEGSLGRAATMIDVAMRIVNEKQASASMVEAVRKTSHKSLDTERLRKTAESPDKHLLLRKVMSFFTELSVPNLLTDLWREQSRDRRTLLLSLLEAHGPAARTMVLERLKGFVPNGPGDDEGFFRRNLLYLLRRIQRPAPPSEDEEADLVSYMAGKGSSLIVLKEAITALGQIKHRKAELMLIQRLGDFEAMLLKPEKPLYAASEMQILLDRTVSALILLGSYITLRRVVDHGLKQQAQLGNTLSRLAELGSQDLSSHTDLVKRLLEALQQALPRKILGLFGSKSTETAAPLIAALSGTNLPEVREALEAIVKRYPEDPIGQAATKALAAFKGAGRPASPATSTAGPGPGHDPTGQQASGDLELFGLPNLLQTLADSRTSADLSLLGRDGRSVATLNLDAGRLVQCQTRNLSGDEAFYQLFERPIACKFSLRKRQDSPESKGAAPPQQLLPLLLEATRRYDELQRSSSLVADEASMQPTKVRATAPPGEQDRELLRGVWGRASLGATPLDCEALIPVDSYRIRRALAHWVEEGSLQLVKT